jgi:hypothetical protein
MPYVPTLPSPLGKAICYWVVLEICSAWRKNAEFSPADFFLVSSLSFQDRTLTCWNPHRIHFYMSCKGTLTDDPKSLYLPPVTLLLVLSLSLTTSCWLVMFLFVAALTSQPFPSIYDGPNLVTERILYSFKLQVEKRQEIIPALCLKK